MLKSRTALVTPNRLNPVPFGSDWNLRLDEKEGELLRGKIREGIFREGKKAEASKWQKSIRDRRMNRKSEPAPKNAKELKDFELVNQRTIRWG